MDKEHDEDFEHLYDYFFDYVQEMDIPPLDCLRLLNSFSASVLLLMGCERNRVVGFSMDNAERICEFIKENPPSE